MKDKLCENFSTHNKGADMFQSYINANSEPLEINEGDYQKEGIWFCGKCNTRKQIQIFNPFEKKTQLIGIVCYCYILEEKKRKELAKADRIKRHRTEAFGGARGYMDSNFASDDGSNPSLTTMCKNYCANFDTFAEDGRGLLLFGTCGTGKSFMACAIGNELIDRGKKVIFYNSSRMVNESFGGKLTDLVNDAVNCDLFILDDLGTETKSEYSQGVVCAVIDARIESGQPMIVTTNLTANQIRNPETASERRTFSRMVGRCHPIEVSGEDLRRKQAREDYQEMEDILRGKNEFSKEKVL